MSLEATIQRLQTRRDSQVMWQPARLQIALIQLLAQGKPVSAKELAAATGQPVEFVTTALFQLQQCGCAVNEQGHVIGSALTLTPTRHKLEVDGVTLYAWCALDTLFLPAYIGKPAHISSTCPATETTIELFVTPKSVEWVKPQETALSIVTSVGCTSGIEGTFCGQVHFFASPDVAREWIGERPDFSVLTVAEAYQLAQKVYIEPMTTSL